MSRKLTRTQASRDITDLLSVCLIQAQAEALQAELRGARAELHRAALELQERHAAAGRLAAKHAVLAARVRPSDEEADAEPRSQVRTLRHRWIPSSAMW